MSSKGNSDDSEDLPEDILLKVGERIKTLRKQKGYKNYETFAFEHGISRSQFGRYEKGKDLRLSTLIRIVKAFNITLEEFFSDGFDQLPD